MLLGRITSQLEKHEGLQLKIYFCTKGKSTIGIGRNLDDRGISEDEARYMLNNDIVDMNNKLSSCLPFYDALDDARQEVLINMAFNLGVHGLLKFKKTLQFIEDGEYEKASVEMLDSKWSTEVHNRANELSQIMKGGTYNVAISS